MKGRTCWRCGKGLGCIPIYGAYWHLPCWRKASDTEREQAREDQARETQTARGT